MTPPTLNGQLLMAFAMTAAVIVVVPGPSVMFIVSRALSVGRPAAMAAAAGNTLGTIALGLLAAVGFGSLIAESDLLYTAIRTVGALYLVGMGTMTIRHRARATATNTAQPIRARGRVARDGFIVGATNPKMLVFFTAALPQFVDRSRGHVVVQMLVLLAIWGVLSIVSDTSWGFVGSSLRTWAADAPQRIERMVTVGGSCVICVGVLLVVSHLS